MNECDALQTINFRGLRSRYLLKLRVEHNYYQLVTNLCTLHI